MKALTICQPFAHLISIGDKRVENRTWPTYYRGKLAIHAGKSRAWLDDTDPAGMVFGAVVAVAVLVDCLHIEKISRGLYISKYPWLNQHVHTEGPWCWVFENVQPLPKPVPYKGAQGLFEIPYQIIETK